ncbi:MAG: hypothetical protein JNG88_00330 [Phycisphaerales bacterium]|nr:hypothetical protein [Phycisphaerales bacterium]
MTGLAVPIAVIRAVLSFSQPDLTEANHVEPVEVAESSTTSHSALQAAVYDWPSNAQVVRRGWRRGSQAPQALSPQDVPPPEDRPRFPTEVSPRQDFDRYGVSRWTPFGYYESYVVLRNEQRRNWRLKYNSDDMRQRRDRLLSAHEKAFRSGVAQLRAGDARKAMITLSMAAELNHSDPASRIHLMQAQLSIGHVEAAAVSLRRALELQPKLAYIDLKLADSFSSPEEWDACIDSVTAENLKPAAQRDVRFMIGFLEFQRGQYDAAHEAFVSAAALGQRDDLTKKYLALTRPARR